jgi:hypothetical protein
MAVASVGKRRPRDGAQRYVEDQPQQKLHVQDDREEQRPLVVALRPGFTAANPCHRPRDGEQTGNDDEPTNPGVEKKDDWIHALYSTCRRPEVAET